MQNTIRDLGTRTRAINRTLRDVSVDVANERRARDLRDRFETSDLDFHQRVRDGYLEMARRSPQDWFVVDGSKSELEVARLIDERVATLPWHHG